jgi:hypothetical protein
MYNLLPFGENESPQFAVSAGKSGGGRFVN